MKGSSLGGSMTAPAAGLGTGGGRVLARYVTGAILARLADEGARVVLVLVALQEAGNAALGGALVAAFMLPHVLAAPLIGWLTDRARRPQRVVALAALGFGTALATATATTGRVAAPVVLVVCLLGGVCGPALTGALSSRLPTLVPARLVPRAFGLDSLVYNLAGIAGPAVVGVLGGLVSARAAGTALAGSAVLAAAVLASLPYDRSGRPPAVSPSTTGEGDGSAASPVRARAGLLAFVRDPVLGLVTAASSVAHVGMGALPVVTSVLATRHHAPAASGWLLTAMGLGGLVGSLAWTWRPLPTGRTPAAVMAFLIAVGVPTALGAAVTTWLPAVAVCLALTGLFVGPLTGALFTAREAHCPAPLRGQIFALGAGLKTTFAAGGAALAGAFAQAPASVQLLLVGAAPAGAGVLGAVALRRHLGAAVSRDGASARAGCRPRRTGVPTG